MYRTLRTWALVASLASLLAGNALAIPAPKVDFTVGPSHPAGATVAYNGSTLVGTNLGVTSVSGVLSPLNSGVLLGITGGTLNFTSGAVTSSSANLLTFGAGPVNSLTISGAIPGLINAASLLLQGTIQSASITSINGETKAVFAVFFNGIRNEIADFFGFPRSTGPLGTGTDVWGGDVLFGITLTSALNAPFVITSPFIGSGDLDTKPAPEPGTLTLACLGIAGVAVYGRRRKVVASS